MGDELQFDYGQAVIEHQLVVSDCFPDCANGGTCSGGACLCPEDFEGAQCQLDICDIRHSFLSGWNVTRVTGSRTSEVTCLNNYESSSDSPVSRQCINGVWSPGEDELIQGGFRCTPKCQKGCQNGGVCVKPNVCACPSQFGGPTCELKAGLRCGTAPTAFVNALLKIMNNTNQEQSMMVECLVGYKLSNDESNFIVRCLGGTWDVEGAPKCVPQCDVPCQNGGSCSSPNTCTCPQSYEGPSCEQRGCIAPMPNDPPFSDIIMVNEGTTETPTIRCEAGYRLRNGNRIGKLVCDYDKWLLEGLERSPLECVKVTACSSMPYIISNAVITEKFPGLLIAECSSGFIFPTGNNAMQVVCIDDQWYESGQRLLTTGCVPHCEQPCLNGGYCHHPNVCKCPVDVSGDQCEIVQCGALPIYGNYDITFVGDGFIQMSCPDGSRLIGGETNAQIGCANGGFQFPDFYNKFGFLECLSDCHGKCQNGGTCLDNGGCNCPLEFEGTFCENPVSCANAPAAIENADLNKISETKYGATCKQGFALPNSKLEVAILCTRNGWTMEGYTIPEVFQKCEARCSEGCHNGGSCTSPGVCVCPPNFTGSKCENEMEAGCFKPPPPVNNSVIEFNTTDGMYTCLEGFAMPRGDTWMALKCRSGLWHITDCECNDEPPDCEPLCPTQCENQGVCQAPGICSCPEGFLGQFCEIEQPKPCLEAPLPIPNSAVKVTSEGTFAVCSKGYQFSSSRTQETIWCYQGEWRFSKMAVGEKMACYPVCRKPCANRGHCVAPDTCMCIDPFTGPTCQDLKQTLCWNKPPAVAFAVIYFSPLFTSIQCQPGYTFPSREVSLNLTCLNGEWLLPSSYTKPLPSCQPRCDPECLNGGICVRPGVCKCSHGLVGKTCTENVTKSCSGPPQAISHSTIRFSPPTVNLRCDYGYRLQAGYSEEEVVCKEGEWVTSTGGVKVDLLSCDPVCERPCMNQGYCVGPNLCKCPEKFIGEFCQEFKCFGEPREIRNSFFEYREDMLFGVTWCNPGYTLPSGDLESSFKCKNGQWQYIIPELHEPDYACYPVCAKPCMNGGWCISPDVCNCPEGFHGDQCQKRYMKTITGTTCQFPFNYAGQWYYGCTGVDYHRPWCATNSNVKNLITSWAVCVADLGMKKVVATFDGSICVFPFQYRGQIFHQCTTMDKGRIWCATSVNSKNQIVSWGFCNPDWGSETTLLTTSGDECQLPFEWQGETFRECVNETHTPWCVTDTSSTGIATRHGYCLSDWGRRKVVITMTGGICKFPFKYKNELYEKCMKNEKNVSECAIKVDDSGNALQLDTCTTYYSEEENMGPNLSLLFPPLDKVTPEIITVNGLRCVLPFQYRGREHIGCIYDDSDRPWCATGVSDTGMIVDIDICPPNWDIPEVNLHVTQPEEEFISGLSSDILEDLPRQEIQLLKGQELNQHLDLEEDTNGVVTASGLRCVFPFVFGGMTHRGCVWSESQRRFWCATEVNALHQVTESDYCPKNWDSLSDWSVGKGKDVHVQLSSKGEKNVKSVLFNLPM